MEEKVPTSVYAKYGLLGCMGLLTLGCFMHYLHSLGAFPIIATVLGTLALAYVGFCAFMVVGFFTKEIMDSLQHKGAYKKAKEKYDREQAAKAGNSN